MGTGIILVYIMWNNERHVHRMVICGVNIPWRTTKRSMLKPSPNSLFIWRYNCAHKIPCKARYIYFEQTLNPLYLDFVVQFWDLCFEIWYRVSQGHCKNKRNVQNPEMFSFRHEIWTNSWKMGNVFGPKLSFFRSLFRMVMLNWVWRIARKGVLQIKKSGPSFFILSERRFREQSVLSAVERPQLNKNRVGQHAPYICLIMS